MSGNVHIVAKGESLYVIAKKYGVSLAKIIALNPVLKERLDIIYPGMSIRVSDQIKTTEARFSKLLFNGETLSIYSIKNDRILAEYPAISGLPPNAPRLAELISKGRKNLKINTDYTKPEFQNKKDAGPIQEDNYTLALKAGMPYDKSKAAGDGAGWGEGGWILTEHLIAKMGNIFGGRFGFFLHHDGGSRGTSGCIGLNNEKDFKTLKAFLVKAQTQGQKSVLIQVKYQ